uniref:histidine kinase n=1 Tax=Palpitomonas bilix TaxID=652834 RepID=A0A7S3G4U3_9EUKA|mmetsp:Transcript_19161/g.49116  ORF Transcript_19161/g.49116 Transcript_19161/m.49116 type:complete len:1248 (+) Transcript_19161:197-3940(+)
MAVVDNRISPYRSEAPPSHDTSQRSTSCAKRSDVGDILSEVSLEGQSSAFGADEREWEEVLGVSLAKARRKEFENHYSGCIRATFKSRALEKGFNDYHIRHWKQLAFITALLELLVVLLGNTLSFFMLDREAAPSALPTAAALVAVYLVFFAVLVAATHSKKVKSKVLFRIISVYELVYLLATLIGHCIIPLIDGPFQSGIGRGSCNCSSPSIINEGVAGTSASWKAVICLASSIVLMPGRAVTRAAMFLIFWCCYVGLGWLALYTHGAVPNETTILVFVVTAMGVVGVTVLTQMQNHYDRVAFLSWASEGRRRIRASKEREKVLAEEGQQRQSFLASVAHDIRTPVHAIQGILELLQNEDRIDMDLRDDFLMLRTSSETLMRLVNDFLDLAKGEAGGLTLENGTFNPYRVTEDQVLALCAKVHHKSIDVQCFIDPKTVPRKIVGDFSRYTQVLNNLLSNAYKFSPPGSTIYLTLEEDTEEYDDEDDNKAKEGAGGARSSIAGVREGGSVKLSTSSAKKNSEEGQRKTAPFPPSQSYSKRKLPAPSRPNAWRGRLSVRDEGPGIPAKEIHHIFEKFYQTSVKSKDLKSTGLGLTICRQICEAMGGRIGVVSREGEGANFVATFAFEQVDNEHEGPVSRSSSAVSSGAKNSIMQRSEKDLIAAGLGRVSSVADSPSKGRDGDVVCVLSSAAKKRGATSSTIEYAKECLHSLGFTPAASDLAMSLDESSGVRLFYKTKKECVGMMDWQPAFVDDQQEGGEAYHGEVSLPLDVLRSQSLGQLPENDLLKPAFSFADPTSKRYTNSFNTKLPRPQGKQRQVGGAINELQAHMFSNSFFQKGVLDGFNDRSLEVLPQLAEHQSVILSQRPRASTLLARAAMHEILFIDVPLTSGAIDSWCLAMVKQIVQRGWEAGKRRLSSSSPAMQQRYHLSVVFVYPIGVLRAEKARELLAKLQTWVTQAQCSFQAMSGKMRRKDGVSGEEVMEARENKEVAAWMDFSLKMMAKPVRRSTVWNGVMECLREPISNLNAGSMRNCMESGMESGIERSSEAPEYLNMATPTRRTKLDPLWHSAEKKAVRERAHSHVSDESREVVVVENEGGRPRSKSKVKRMLEHLHVLIVDDEQMNIAILRRMLRALGVKSIDSSTSGEDALAKMKATGFGMSMSGRKEEVEEDMMTDVLLIDRQLGGMSGDDVVKAARHAGLACPVILVTAAITAEQREASAMKGVNEVLLKPFKASDLTSILLRWCPQP